MTDFGVRRRQLLKTGQTILYKTGDDGDLEKGLPRSYTLLTTGQHTGTTDITINAKTHPLSNEAVMDNSTGLMWARYVPDDDIGPDDDGKLFWDDAVGGNSEDIWELVDQANSGSGLGGYTDWTVANVVELFSLATHGTVNPSINTTAFPSTPNDNQWTSTTRHADTARAWVVDFGSPFISRDYKTSGKYYCRLVRAG